MSTDKGRGRRTHIRARRDRILAALRAAEHPLTTSQVATATKIHYGTVYADLRALCGSHAMDHYARMGEVVNEPGYPVVWHSWESGGAYVTWELADWFRDLETSGIAELEAILSLPTGGDDR